MSWRSLFGAVNAAGGLLRRLGLRPVRFDAEALADEARSRTGLEDFGDRAFAEPYRRLVGAYREADHLTLLGRAAARSDLLRLLSNRLRLVESRRRHPSIRGEEVTAPLVVASLPRTGTTLLHGLLAQDPRNRAPATWEVMYPAPPPGTGRGVEDRMRRVRRQLGWFDRMAPEYKVAHPVGAELPQECMAITTHAFESPRFHRTHRLPGYREWIGRRDHRHAYRFHRRLLQHLQWRTPGERWVLKSPPHAFWIETLHRTYPEARYVQTHREPLTVLASFASHTAALRRAFVRGPAAPDPDRLARRWSEAMGRMMDFRDGGAVPADRFVDVRFRDLVRNPLAEVRRIYRGFDLPLGDEARERMRRFLRRHPRYEHGVHRYGASEYGVDPEAHGPLFDRYRSRFGIEPTEEDARRLRR